MCSSPQPLPYEIDAKQLGALRAFRSALQSQHFVGTYSNENDLRSKVRRAIEYDLAAMSSPSGSSSEVRVPTDQRGSRLDGPDDGILRAAGPSAVPGPAPRAPAIDEPSPQHDPHLADCCASMNATSGSSRHRKRNMPALRPCIFSPSSRTSAGGQPTCDADCASGARDPSMASHIPTPATYRIGSSIFRVGFGSITQSGAEVLVSSDDNYLTMGGGVSATILRAGETPYRNMHGSSSRSRRARLG